MKDVKIGEKIELARLEIEGHNDVGFVVAAKDQICNQLRNAGYQVTATWNKEGWILITGDPSVATITRQVLNAAVSSFKRTHERGNISVNVRFLYSKNNMAALEQELAALRTYIETSEIELGRTRKRLEGTEQERDTAVKELADASELLRMYEKEVADAKEKVTEAKESSLGQIEALKKMRKENSDLTNSINKYQKGLFIDGEEISTEEGDGIDSLFLEAFSRIEMPKIKDLIYELESDAEEVTRSYGLTREQIYERIAMGMKDIEEYQEYEAKKKSHDDALSAMKRVMSLKENWRELEKYSKSPIDFSDIDNAINSNIADFDSLQQEYVKNGEIASRLNKPRKTVRFYMELMECDSDYMLNFYLPLEFKERQENLTATEREILDVVLKSWTELREDEKGEGSVFTRTDKKGITQYKFKLPRFRIDQKRMQHIKDSFKQKIYENGEKSPLALMGVKFNISELEHYQPSTKCRDEEPYKPQSTERPQKPSVSPNQMDVFSITYRTLSKTAEERGVRVPQPDDLSKKYETALRSAAVMAAIGREGASRSEIVNYVEENVSELGTYQRNTRNKTDTAIDLLLRKGVIRRDEGIYKLSDGYVI